MSVCVRRGCARVYVCVYISYIVVVMSIERHCPIFDGLISQYYAVLICLELYSRSSNASHFEYTIDTASVKLDHGTA